MNAKGIELLCGSKLFSQLLRRFREIVVLSKLFPHYCAAAQILFRKSLGVISARFHVMACMCIISAFVRPSGTHCSHTFGVWVIKFAKVDAILFASM